MRDDCALQHRRPAVQRARVHADVEVHGELTLGQTVFDVAARGGKRPTADVAFDPDERKFVKLLMDTFAPQAASTHRSLLWWVAFNRVPPQGASWARRECAVMTVNTWAGRGSRTLQEAEAQIA